MTAVFQNWAHLGHRPFRLLVGMAVTAKDKDDPPVYYGGRDMSAGFLGYTLESETAQRSAFRNVQKVIDELLEAGAIARLSAPSPRSNARYAINVDGPANGWPSGSPVRKPKGDRKGHLNSSVQVTAKAPNGWPSGHQQVTVKAPTGDRQGVPEEEVGTHIKDEIEDYPAPEATRSPVRGRAASGDGDVLVAEIVEETGYDLGPMSPELASLFAPPASKAPETAQCSNCIREVDLWAIDRYQGRPVCISCKETLTGGEPW